MRILTAFAARLVANPRNQQSRLRIGLWPTRHGQIQSSDAESQNGELILSIRCIILGLLETQNRCGYELQREVCDLLGGDPAADSRIYQALGGLVGGGLIEKCTHKARGRRSRIPYAISPAGREYLTDWLAQPLGIETPRSDGLLARIVITARSKPEFLKGHFADLEQQFEGRMAQRDTALRTCGGDSDVDFTRRIALLHQACRDRADLGWLRMVRATWQNR